MTGEDENEAEDDIHHYFAYGSNINAARLIDRCPGASDRRGGTLPGHRLVFNKATNDFDGSGAANIEADQDAEVQGALYTLRTNDLHRLDQVEGHPRHYTRRLHAVTETDGTQTIAWVYHATPTYVRDGLRPRRDYLGLLLQAEDLLSEKTVRMLMDTPCFD